MPTIVSRTATATATHRHECTDRGYEVAHVAWTATRRRGVSAPSTWSTSLWPRTRPVGGMSAPSTSCHMSLCATEANPTTNWMMCHLATRTSSPHAQVGHCKDILFYFDDPRHLYCIFRVCSIAFCFLHCFVIRVCWRSCKGTISDCHQYSFPQPYLMHKLVHT